MSCAEEILRGGGPSELGGRAPGLAVPTILDHGSGPRSSAASSGRSVTGDEVWCQLFSEPGAGSDLAGLSTRPSR